ncbi:MAG: MBL fold metallo-hydrolase [Desulfobacterales bacterium]|nr:MBL fold metallo-hydrolase [Desulfobacterales bacterium]
MKDQYIPEDCFPMEINPRVRLLGNYFFNLTLITGPEKSALFEAGISGVADQVIRQLDHLEIEPDFLVVSHPHSDHITGLPALMDKFPDAKVIAGKGAKDFISHPKAGPALIKEDEFMSQGLEKMGITPGRESLKTIPNLDNAIEISTRERLELGKDIFLDLIPVKGHSPGNLIGLTGPDKVLCCSDSLGFHYPGRKFWPLFFTSAKDYIETIELIRSLEPQILCPAHQGPIFGDQVKDAIDQSDTQTQKMIQRIQQTKMEDPDLVTELFDESYRDEFTLYTEQNILNCTRLLLKRAREI